MTFTRKILQNNIVNHFLQITLGGNTQSRGSSIFRIYGVEYCKEKYDDGLSIFLMKL